MKNFSNFISAFFVIISLTSNGGCDTEPVQLIDIPESTNGMVPVYDINEDWKIIEVQPGKNILQPNSVISGDGFDIVIHDESGIYIADQNNPSNKSIAFISIPLFHTVQLNQDTLFVGNYLDRLTFSIADPYNVQLISRDVDFFPDIEPLAFPPGYEGFFECPDFDKGVILDWEQAVIKDPQCWR